MKAIGIIGSPRKNGNTEILTAHALRAAAEEGLETEIIRLGGMDIRPCTACMACREEETCTIKDDVFPGLYERMREADALIMATPVNFGSATANIKAVMDRIGYISGMRRRFAGKVGGPLVVARRAGQNYTQTQLMLWFHLLGFYMAGSTYWNIAFGREKGEVEKDEEGMRTAWNFGKNLAALAKKVNA